MTVLYTLFDDDARFHLGPFTAQNEKIFVRSLAEAIQANVNTQWVKYPDRFVVYEVATFDDDSGVVKGSSAPIRVGVLADLVKAQFST